MPTRTDNMRWFDFAGTTICVHQTRHALQIWLPPEPGRRTARIWHRLLTNSDPLRGHTIIYKMISQKTFILIELFCSSTTTMRKRQLAAIRTTTVAGEAHENARSYLPRYHCVTEIQSKCWLFNGGDDPEKKNRIRLILGHTSILCARICRRNKHEPSVKRQTMAYCRTNGQFIVFYVELNTVVFICWSN